MQYWININNISNDIRLDPDYYAMEIEIQKFYADKSFVLLEDIAEIVTDGSRNAKQFVADGIPYLRIANLTPPVISKTKLLYLPSYEGIEERAVTEKGDILIAKSRSLEKMLWVDASSAGMVLGPDIIRIKLKRPEDAPLLISFLRSKIGRMLVNQSVVGTAIPRLSTSEIRKLRIPAFKWGDQDTIDELYQKQQDNKEDISKLYERWNNLYGVSSNYLREEVLPDYFFIQNSDIDLTRLDFKYYQLQQSRTNQELLERMKWEEWVELDSVAEIVKTTVSPGDWEGRLIRYIGLGSVKPETFHINEAEEIEYGKVKVRARYSAVENDVIIGIMGPNIGERTQGLAIIKKDWENSLISSVFAVIRCRDINPYYLLWCLQHPLVRFQLRRLARGQWQKMLAISDVGSILIPLLEYSQQEEISGMVESFIGMMSARG
ncbi:MAG: hypothetical protein PHV56_01710 [Clostridia bacterium]|nr:hypothetical protein [Clostridia bacterium]